MDVNIMTERDVLYRTIDVGGGGRPTEQVADELVDNSKAFPNAISEFRCQ